MKLGKKKKPEEKTVFFKEGDLIIRQGTEPKMAYLIKKGNVCVAKKQGGEEIEIARLGPGQIVGEMALIKGYRCAATVTALGAVEAQPIPPAVINKELAQMSLLMRRILCSLVERLYNETFVKK